MKKTNAVSPFVGNSVLRREWLASLASVICALGCSADGAGSRPPSGGATASGGSAAASGGSVSSNGGVANGSGGAPSAGGQPPANGGTLSAAGGATSSGGSGFGGAASGGSLANGGRASGGTSTTDGGSAGAGGAAGSNNAAGAAGSSSTAAPSAGCGKAGRPSNGVVTVSGDHIYNFPASYDGTKPLPLLIGLHAAGNPIDQIQTLIKGSAFETNYVRAFPTSAGNEWVYNTDLNKVLKVYDELMSTYCIDKSRVFATGHSSGAQMIVQILVHSDAAQHLALKAVAPVAASNYGAILSPIPVMYIQGKNDNQRNSNGSEVVARFTAVNKCTTTTMAYASVAGCNSTQNSAKVEPGCVSYQGCSQPTIWCSHNDPNYSSTNHGWPCFATTAMYDFFTALP